MEQKKQSAQYDMECIRSYLNGDSNALTPLVQNYRRPLFAFILKMTEGREDADEIFQETWFRAIKSLPRFKQKNFLSWLFRIAHNLIIDRARRAKRNISMQTSGSREEAATLEDRLADGALLPDQRLEGNQLGEEIRSALTKLSPEQQEVFVLRMYSGLSFKEISAIQNCSINTSLARMQYALTKMRSMLKERYEEL